MRIVALEFKNIKNFEGKHRVELDPETKCLRSQGAMEQESPQFSNYLG